MTCFRIQSFQHLVIRFCGGLVRWKSSTASALGSSSCLSAHMAATSLTMQRWASDLVINPLTSLCSYISVPQTCLAPTASCAANMHNKEEWNAGVTNMTGREEDVHDCHPVRQGHVSAFLSHLPRLPVSQLCFPIDAWTFRFKSLSACLPACLPVSLSVSAFALLCSALLCSAVCCAVLC